MAVMEALAGLAGLLWRLVRQPCFLGWQPLAQHATHGDPQVEPLQRLRSRREAQYETTHPAPAIQAQDSCGAPDGLAELATGDQLEMRGSGQRSA